MSYDFNEASSHIMNTYGRLDPVITHGEGVYLYDKDNNKYLDFISNNFDAIIINSLATSKSISFNISI